MHVLYLLNIQVILSIRIHIVPTNIFEISSQLLFLLKSMCLTIACVRCRLLVIRVGCLFFYCSIVSPFHSVVWILRPLCSSFWYSELHKSYSFPTFPVNQFNTIKILFLSYMNVCWKINSITNRRVQKRKKEHLLVYHCSDISPSCNKTLFEDHITTY